MYTAHLLINSNFFALTFAGTTNDSTHRSGNMKKYPAILLIGLFLLGCGSSNQAPNISDIKADMPLLRFDRDLFSIDTNRIPEELGRLLEQYPGFYRLYMNQFLGASGNPADEQTAGLVRHYIHNYRDVYDTLQKVFKDSSRLKTDIEEAFRYLKYQLPDFRTGNIYVFVGPFDAPGVATLTPDIAVGLHQFAGKQYSVYGSPALQTMFPDYVSRRFEPQYIPTNCIKAVLQDLFPQQIDGRPLVEQIIEYGKQWYALDRILPKIADSVKTGFTQKQLDWCEASEGDIWTYLVQNENLNSNETFVIQTYLGDAPFTQGMPSVSPGNIGQWVGWQIVKKYAADNSSLSIKDIMATDARTILDEAKYKPK